MPRIAAFASLLLVLVGCSNPISGSAAMSSIPTNTAGRVHITFDPCKDIPAKVIADLKLSKPRPDSQTDGEIETVFCKYRSQGKYYLTIAASNHTLEALKKANKGWDLREIEVGGRKAISTIDSPQPSTDDCSINVSATTGVYGVLVGTADHSFDPYPDCMTAVRTNTEALLPYFPL
ncbi:DUF3558 domain-containing protein [Mycobacterium sp. CBMA271]|uniref:DUF3558 domain-containing protein n=1 Tax=unclassified Mycobacteroides TaxID=2618759 RepID=UPI0012DFB1EC|nr:MULTISPECIES: DUF3558 domain-containing protein [unclassified Mycobacteroides]MUM15997.1 hypothetical protein [Mycobacteroides sp. CBMA 326]MUM22504.1 DUF3558 domain-containing protein [Mycobacteroides sp. CBMA 271]